MLEWQNALIFITVFPRIGSCTKLCIQYYIPTCYVNGYGGILANSYSPVWHGDILIMFVLLIVLLYHFCQKRYYYYKNKHACPLLSLADILKVSRRTDNVYFWTIASARGHVHEVPLVSLKAN